MTYIPDLSNHCFLATGPRLRAIGWLEWGESFDEGAVDPAFIGALRLHLENPFGVSL